MKKLIAIIVFALAFSFNSNAQETMKKEEVQTITLEQTKGKFTQDKLTLKEGSYVFNIRNNYAGVDVGFVLVPSGKDTSNPKNHIQEAYVTQVVKEGETQSSNTVNLWAGTYTYFCPLNKTPQYTLVVE